MACEAYVSVCSRERAEKKKEGFQLEYIGPSSVFSPSTAVVEVTKELDRMANLAATNLTRAMNALITLDDQEIQQVYETKKNINYMNHAIMSLPGKY